jgi:DnaK suppressor protein
MQNSQAHQYRINLEKKLAELTEPTRKREDIAVEKTPDLIDEVQLTAQRELTLVGLNQAWRIGAQIRAALSRIEDGSYGICMHCEEEIKPKRLEAIPWAAYCIQCQEAAEKNPQEFKDTVAARSVQDEAETPYLRKAA